MLVYAWIAWFSFSRLRSCRWFHITPNNLGPSPRERAFAAINDVPGQNPIIVIGGGFGGSGNPDEGLHDIFYLDLVLLIWTLLPDYTLTKCLVAGNPAYEFPEGATFLYSTILNVPISSGGLCQLDMTYMDADSWDLVVEYDLDVADLRCFRS